MTDEPKTPPVEAPRAELPPSSSYADQIAKLTAALEQQGRLYADQLAQQAAQFTAALAAVMASKGPTVVPVPAKLPGTSFAALWTAYVQSLGERTWIGNMLSMMRLTLAHFAPSLTEYRPRYHGAPARFPVAGPDIAVEDIQVAHWTDWRMTMRGQSATYRNLVLARLKAFLAWAENDGRIKFHPLAKAKPEKKRPRRETTITDKQGQAILAEQPHVYFQAIMAIAGQTGMRRDEVRCLRWSQIDMDTGRVRLSWTTTKSKKSRDVYLFPEMVAMLYDLQKWTKANRRRGMAEVVFPGEGPRGLPVSKSWLGKMFRRACDRAGVQAAPGDGNVHFHDATRHTFATEFLRRGGDIRVLQRILGHSSLQTTQLYVHSDQEEVRRGFEEMHRKARKPADSSD